MRSLRQGLTSAVRPEASEDVNDDLSGWAIETLVILPNGDVNSPQVLKGNPYGLPEYEAMCLRRDANSKDEKSRRRMYIVLALAMAGACFAGCQRLIKSIRVSQSYGFVRRSVLANSDVRAVLGPAADVQTSSGTFTARYINARLRLVGSEGAVADVDVAATREEGDSWRIALARMRVAGASYNLNLAGH